MGKVTHLYLNEDLAVKESARELYSLLRRRSHKQTGPVVPLMTILRDLVQQGGTVESFERRPHVNFIVTLPDEPWGANWPSVRLQRWATQPIERGGQTSGKEYRVLIVGRAHMDVLRGLLGHQARWVGFDVQKIQGRSRPVYTIATDNMTRAEWWGNPALHILEN